MIVGGKVQVNRIDTDILVLGGGLAAAQAALESRKLGVKVLIADKGRFGFSGATTTSGGNPQAWFPAEKGGDPGDSREILFKDIMKGGEEVAHSEAAKIFSEEIYDRIVEAVNIGVPFRKNKEGKFLTYHTLGMSYPRLGPVWKGGAGMMLAYRREAFHRGITILEQIKAVKLLKENGKISGALGYSLKTEELFVFTAKAVILCCGSATELYPLHSAAFTASGDSYYLGYEAGAELVNMEFQEFTVIPQILGVPIAMGGIKPLLSAGGIFVNRKRDRFLELGITLEEGGISRSQLVMAIERQIREGNGPCYLDLSEVSNSSGMEGTSYPVIIKKMTSLGMNPLNERVPWIPALHGFLGGLRINMKGETCVPGLYSAGEAAGHGGVFGADRVGGAIGACMVFGSRAGNNAARYALESYKSEPSEKLIEEEIKKLEGLSDPKGNPVSGIIKETRELAGRNLSVLREEQSLFLTANKLQQFRLEPLESEKNPFSVVEARSLALTGEMVASTALFRKESRGQHYRLDFPDRDNENYRTNLVLRGRRDSSEELILEKEKL